MNLNPAEFSEDVNKILEIIKDEKEVPMKTIFNTCGFYNKRVRKAIKFLQENDMITVHNNLMNMCSKNVYPNEIVLSRLGVIS